MLQINHPYIFTEHFFLSDIFHDLVPVVCCESEKFRKFFFTIRIRKTVRIGNSLLIRSTGTCTYMCANNVVNTK
jgi:hypothetical protein